MLISSIFIVLVSLCFSLFCSLAVVGFHTHLVNGFGIFCFTPFVCVSAYVCQRHWITYLILLCFYVVITCVCFCLECITLIHSFFQFVMSLCHLLLFGCIWFSLCISDSWQIVLLTVIYKFVLLCALLHFHHFDAPASFYIDMTYV